MTNKLELKNKEEYQDFCDTIFKLTNLLYNIEKNNSYISFTKEEEQLTNLLKEKIIECQKEVKKIDQIKETLQKTLYQYHNIIFRKENIILKNMNNYYIAYLDKNYNRDNREVIGDFICCFDIDGNLTREAILGEKLIYSDESGFLAAICTEQKEENNYYNFDFYYMTFKDNTYEMTTRISNLQEIYVLNNNLLYFVSSYDNSIIIYDKKTQKAIIDKIDMVKEIYENYDNFNYDNHYLIEKKIICNDKSLMTYFFIDKFGNIASNVLDEVGNIYIINQEKDLNTSLKEIFKQIEENLKSNSKESSHQKLTLKNLPNIN